MRRRIIECCILFVVCISLCGLYRLFNPQPNEESLTTVEAFCNAEYSAKRILSYEDVPLGDDMVQKLRRCATIVKVKPLDDLRHNNYVISQKMIVQDCIRGDLCQGDIIWITCPSGPYKGNLEPFQIMYPEYTYYVALDDFHVEQEYFPDFRMMALRTTEVEKGIVLNRDEYYSYGDLQPYSFYADSEDALKSLYQTSSECISYIESLE